MLKRCEQSRALALGSAKHNLTGFQEIFQPDRVLTSEVSEEEQLKKLILTISEEEIERSFFCVEFVIANWGFQSSDLSLFIFADRVFNQSWSFEWKPQALQIHIDKYCTESALSASHWQTSQEKWYLNNLHRGWHRSIAVLTGHMQHASDPSTNLKERTSPKDEAFYSTEQLPKTPQTDRIQLEEKKLPK